MSYAFIINFVLKQLSKIMQLRETLKRDHKKEMPPI